MKKLVLTFAVALALCGTMVSCSSKDNTAGELKSKIENCTNPDSLRTYVDQAGAYAQKLVREGKIDEAKKYLAEIEPVVKEKAPALAGTFATVTEALDKVKDVAGSSADKAKASAEAAADSASSAASSAVDAVKEKAGEVGDAVKDKTNEVVDATKEKAQQAKDATAEAAQNAADKVKDALK